MRLWTIQPLVFYQELKEKKVIRARKEFIDNNFQLQYEWMIKKMEELIGNRPDKGYPLWAWYQYISKKKIKPDLRRRGHLNSGTPGVRLEIEKQEKDVLLSDFDLWHLPLLEGCINNSEIEALEFDKHLEELGLESTEFKNLPPYLKSKIIKSWDKIFDMEFDCEYYTRPAGEKSIQATFWELKMEEVRKVDFFRAR